MSGPLGSSVVAESRVELGLVMLHGEMVMLSILEVVVTGHR